MSSDIRQRLNRQNADILARALAQPRLKEDYMTAHADAAAAFRRAGRRLDGWPAPQQFCAMLASARSLANAWVRARARHEPRVVLDLEMMSGMSRAAADDLILKLEQHLLRHPPEDPSRPSN
jgi:hypothetical protein